MKTTRADNLKAMHKEMSRYFSKSSPASQARQPHYSREDRARIKVRELLRGGEITAGRAKKMLQKITTRFTPFNNESLRTCN